ncbi:hypothetical protein LXA55_18135, partial [Erwinia amylovora]|uniref:hypothetical protein n=1 Tax=Erwinia amylovora TaxID=552 RepID=UPI0020C06159
DLLHVGYPVAMRWKSRSIRAGLLLVIVLRPLDPVQVVRTFFDPLPPPEWARRREQAVLANAKYRSRLPARTSPVQTAD